MDTKLILVRHAKCIGNISNKLLGRTDFELTENGKKFIITQYIYARVGTIHGCR